MADFCKNCGKTEEEVALSDCQKCRLVAYCSRKCQRKDKENHQQTCKRRDAAGTAPCDLCQDTEAIGHIINVCVECGIIACWDCTEPIIRSHAGNAENPPCPNTNCHGSLCEHTDPECAEKLEKLIQENVGDPRRSQWIYLLGHAYHWRDDERKAMMWYNIAGSLGFAKGYMGAARLYGQRGEWGQVKESLKRAADLDDVLAMESLGVAAMLGYFIMPGGIVQEVHRPEPNWEEVYHWSQKGARLGHPACCGQLGTCYLNGKGVDQDCEKGFKWTLKGAEMGSMASMLHCARCYENGDGVEQSNEKAVEWLEKYLELEDDVETRGWLERLRARGADQARQT